MSQVIKHLRSLDRKERFAILREALGFDPKTPRLDGCFRNKLHKCIGVDIPEQAFLAMDYHLDWIQLALHLAENTQIQPGKTFEIPGFDNINNNQEDIDLLVAFEDDRADRKKTHLVLIEAKAYLHWDKEQLSRKVKRLKCMFGPDGNGHAAVIPHFVLMAGREPRNITADCLPQWRRSGKRPFLLKYTLHPRLKVTRCTDRGRPFKNRTQLRLDPVPRRGS